LHLLDLIEPRTWCWRLSKLLGSSVLDAAAAQGMMERPRGRPFLVAAGEAERRRGSTEGMEKVRAGVAAIVVS